MKNKQNIFLIILIIYLYNNTNLLYGYAEINARPENNININTTLECKLEIIRKGGGEDIVCHWLKYIGQNFQFYKLVHSTTDPNVKYLPDQENYLWYTDNIDITNIDESQFDNGKISNIDKQGINYFRICIVTTNGINCSNTSQINFKKNLNIQNNQNNKCPNGEERVDNKCQNIYDVLLSFETILKDTNAKLINNTDINYLYQTKNELSNIEQQIYPISTNYQQVYKELITKIYNKLDIISRILDQKTKLYDIVQNTNFKDLKTDYTPIKTLLKNMLNKPNIDDSDLKNINSILKQIEKIEKSRNILMTGNNLNKSINYSVNKPINKSVNYSNDKFIADISNVGTWSVFGLGSLIVTFFFLIYQEIKSKLFSFKINIQKELKNIYAQKLSYPLTAQFTTNILNIYNKLLEKKYKISPYFLVNFIISLKTRGFVILFGGNGVGKTSFVEKLMSTLYSLNSQNYLLKILINKEVQDERSFLGFYDRLNNSYIDPFGVTKFITRAYKDKVNPYIMLFDEINMQDIELYFNKILETDTILELGESSFIKIGELLDTDGEDLKKKKLEIIQDYDFIVEEKENIISFGMKIPSNLYFVGTANVDKAVEPFTGKVLDRADVIKMNYMGEENYEQEVKIISNLQLSLIRENTWISKDKIEIDTLEFISQIKNIFNFSKRVDKSLCYYILLSKDFEYLNISQAINQKILPRSYGEEYRTKLTKLLEICYKYNSTFKLQSTINQIENLLNNDYINYWSIT